MSMQMTRGWVYSATVAAIFVTAGSAQACEANYTVVQGDTLFSIAQANLGDTSAWPKIFQENPVLLGEDLMEVTPGLVLTLPCPEGTVNAASPEPEPETEIATAQEPETLVIPKPETPAPSTPATVRAMYPDAELILVTGTNYAPFTDRDWPEQGMLTELVQTALDHSPAQVPYAITWEDDWGKQMDIMTRKDGVDMGFPWFRPDCASTPDNEQCAAFHFSAPLVELAILLFSRREDPVSFSQDSDLHGKTLCRPAGFFTHDLERPGRDWMNNGLVKIEQPPTPDDCFRMLVEGSVDAVSVNEFLGVQKIFELGLAEKVAAGQRPLSVEGLHVLISKKHWRGTAHLYRFNAGLAELKKSEKYDEIVSRHLALFWEQING